MRTVLRLRKTDKATLDPVLCRGCTSSGSSPFTLPPEAGELALWRAAIAFRRVSR
jgi:hypothetical protein